MKKSILWLSVIATLSQTAHAEALSSRKTQGFIKDFYKAMTAREDKKLDAMIADDAKINIHLTKMNQSFSLSKSQYLQQIKAAWHFGHHEKYKLSNIKYTLTQAGLSANLTLRLNESRTILNEDLSQEQEMNIDLTLIDEQIKISNIKTVTNF